MCLILRDRMRGKGSTTGYAYKVVVVEDGKLFNLYRNAKPTQYYLGVASEELN